MAIREPSAENAMAFAGTTGEITMVANGSNLNAIERVVPLAAIIGPDEATAVTRGFNISTTWDEVPNVQVWHDSPDPDTQCLPSGENATDVTDEGKCFGGSEYSAACRNCTRTVFEGLLMLRGVKARTRYEYWLPCVTVESTAIRTSVGSLDTSWKFCPSAERSRMNPLAKPE